MSSHSDPTAIARRVLDRAGGVSYEAAEALARAYLEAESDRTRLLAHVAHIEDATAGPDSCAGMIRRYEAALAYARRHLEPGAVAEVERILGT